MIDTLKPSAPFDKVVVCSGHMIDRPDQPPRFPANKEKVVREHIARQLESWLIGTEDLGICGGARGADILFAECCIERGAQVRLFIPLPEDEFIQRSIHLPDSNWEARYFALAGHPRITKLFQEEQIGAAPGNVSVFARNNDWIVNTAQLESKPGKLFAMLVWDEKLTGNGPGGTSDLAAKIQELGGQIAIINPTKL
jgi:hypothetical protein